MNHTHSFRWMKNFSHHINTHTLTLNSTLPSLQKLFPPHLPVRAATPNWLPQSQTVAVLVCGSDDGLCLCVCAWTWVLWAGIKHANVVGRLDRNKVIDKVVPPKLPYFPPLLVRPLSLFEKACLGNLWPTINPVDSIVVLWVCSWGVFGMVARKALDLVALFSLFA